MISVIIPAYNEEKYLPSTLASFRAAADGHEVELIVVDNVSTDKTAEVARSFGACVLAESEHNIARVRNAGARAARGEILVFLDADTQVPMEAFGQIVEAMRDRSVAGGSFAVKFDWNAESSAIKRHYIRLCMWAGNILKIRMGAMQFCSREGFHAIAGYDETIYVGEDSEFQYRLDRYARDRGGRTIHFYEPKAVTSARRFNQVGLLRIVFMYHPITIYLLWRRASVWKDWYQDAIR